MPARMPARDNYLDMDDLIAGVQSMAVAARAAGNGERERAALDVLILMERHGGDVHAEPPHACHSVHEADGVTRACGGTPGHIGKHSFHSRELEITWENEEPDNCRACWHLWSSHDENGCHASNPLDGEYCQCTHTGAGQ